MSRTIYYRLNLYYIEKYQPCQPAGYLKFGPSEKIRTPMYPVNLSTGSQPEGIQTAIWGVVRVLTSCFNFHRVGCFHYTNDTFAWHRELDSNQPRPVQKTGASSTRLSRYCLVPSPGYAPGFTDFQSVTFTRLVQRAELISTVYNFNINRF